MPAPPLKTLFKLLLVLVVPTMLALGLIDLQLRVPGNAHGILSFEFCGWADGGAGGLAIGQAGNCAATMAAWGAPGRQWAMLSLGLDYLFMLEYAGLVALGLWMAAERLSVRAALQADGVAPGSGALLARVVLLRRFAAAAVVAALFDAAENLCLIGVVHSGHGGLLAWWAALFASIKFALIGAALLAWGSVWWRIKNQK